MPKRKSESLEFIVKKLKYLEEEMKRSRRRSRHRRVSSTSSSSSSSSRSQSSDSVRDFEKTDNNGRALTERGEVLPQISSENRPQMSRDDEPVEESRPECGSPQPSTSRATAAAMEETEPVPQLEVSGGDAGMVDPQILNILGDDPTTVVEYGPAINPELANRLAYILRAGLKAEERKDFIKKYPVPENCQSIGAPELNAEIKAALTEAQLKRDKALETRQKSLATVISCLGRTITYQINSSQPDHELLQHLVDATRLLSDVHYNDSTARKSFALSTLKKDVKEQLLANTTIEKHLFGDNLGETLKTAKAVSKSGAELKEQVKKFSGPGKNLNWKTTSGSNRQQAANSSAPSRQPPPMPSSTLRTGRHRHRPSQPPEKSTRTSSHRPRQTRRH